jgi:GAF domain-containing protein
MQSTCDISELEDALARDGVRAALALLNGLTDHRFTALYRFDGEFARNLYFFDRERPSVEEAGDMDEIPLTVTYCVYIQETGRPFVIQDALADDRLIDHPSRSRIQAYCGVPLTDADGRTFAAMCHFDFRPVAVDGSHVELMESLGPLLVRRDRKLAKA